MPAWLLPAVAGAGLGLLGTSLKGSAPSPSSAAAPYFNKIPEYGRQAYNPYIQEGQRVMPGLESTYNRLSGSPLSSVENQYAQLTNDPSAFINAIQGKYQPSAGYQYKQNQLSRGLANTAAAGGYRGNQFEQMQQAELMNALLGGDMQQWLENNLGVYGMGLQGQQNLANIGLSGLQSISDRGFDASSRLADYLGSATGQQGANAFENQRYKNANRNALIDSLLNVGQVGLGAASGAGLFGGGGGGGAAKSTYNPLSGGDNRYHPETYVGRRI